jgi:hypothetical protein
LPIQSHFQVWKLSYREHTSTKEELRPTQVSTCYQFTATKWCKQQQQKKKKKQHQHRKTAAL